MPLRLIEILIANDAVDIISRLPSAESVLGRWDDRLNDEQTLVRMLVTAVSAETMLDDLEERFLGRDGFRVMILPVEATLPRPSAENLNNTNESIKSRERISREEIYNDVAQGAQITKVFIVQVVIATVVAAVGLMRNDNVAIIGAMVIAPLLGPNMSLCLATTLGDIGLAMQSLKTNATGLAVALLVSLLVGSVFTFDTDMAAIDARTRVSGGDILLASASGCAGVLAFTTGAPAALIGVMVAVALLPPFVVFGLLLAAGDYPSAHGALLLVATNVICVNLAGVLTFVAQGMRPRSWWEAKRAKRTTLISIAIWVTLLLVLVVLMLTATNV